METRTITTTWRGRPGTSTEYARTKNALKAHGERVITHQWADEAEVITVRHIKGDGRGPSFAVFADVTVATMAEAEAWALAQLVK